MKEFVNSTILVTGATGFIASHIIKELLTNGYSVIGTIRPKCVKDYSFYFTTIPILKTYPERLKIVPVELANEKSYYPLVKKCVGVFHLACPLPKDFKDPIKEMYEPAVNGTLSILKASSKDFSIVKRFIYTSSAATIRQIYNNPNLDYNYRFSDDDWNTIVTLEDDSYGFSKTQAEKKGFQYVRKNNVKFDIISINPTLVFGPVIHDISQELNFSNKMLLDLMTKNEENITNRNFSAIDVRDVAKIHVLAFEHKGCGMARFFTTNEGILESKAYNILKEKFSEQIPFFFRRNDSKSSVSSSDNRIRNNIKDNKILKFELKNLKKYFGMSSSGKDLISIDRSVIDLFQSLVDQDYFSKYFSFPKEINPFFK